MLKKNKSYYFSDDLNSLLNTNKLVTKNGNNGNLYLTNAPKFAVAKPTPKPNIITKLKEKIKNGSAKILLKNLKKPILKIT